MPNNKTNKRRSSTERYYVDGNTVRKMNALPEEYPEYRKSRNKKQREDIRRKQNIRRKQERAMRLDLFSVIGFVIAFGIVAAFSVRYVSLRNQITFTNDQISELQAELNSITNDNIAMEERINASIDLATVYQRAVNEFGMESITEDQIHYYTDDNQNYVKQYGSIPTAN